MNILAGNETNPFDPEAFTELNNERFGGSLSVSLNDDGSAVISTPDGMCDQDLTDAVHLIDVDSPIIH